MFSKLNPAEFQVKALKDFVDDGNRQVQLTFQRIVKQGAMCSFWDGYLPQPVTVRTFMLHFASLKTTRCFVS